MLDFADGIHGDTVVVVCNDFDLLDGNKLVWRIAYMALEYIGVGTLAELFSYLRHVSLLQWSNLRVGPRFFEGGKVTFDVFLPFALIHLLSEVA
jgi:hypothetical protein